MHAIIRLPSTSFVILSPSMKYTRLTLTPLLEFFLNPNLQSRSFQFPSTKFKTHQASHGSRSKVTTILNPNHFYTTSSQVHSELLNIIDVIKRNDLDLESKLNQQKTDFSHSVVSRIMISLNDQNVAALSFFKWVFSSCSLEVTPEICNLFVDNLGRLDDFDTMLVMLNDFSVKKLSLTEKAFAFIRFRNSSQLKVSVSKAIEILVRVGGSCKSTGIHSLIKVLCGMSCFDMALFVMEETVKKSSYYNVLIAAKCKSGSFSYAQNVLDEMRKFGCEPDLNSYNYLLGSLVKHKRLVEACELMENMEVVGYFPSAITFEVVVIHACSNKKMDIAMEFLNRMLLEGIRPRFTTHAAFIKGYFNCGSVNDAHKYVLDMCLRDKSSSTMNYSLLAKLFWQTKMIVKAGGILYEMMEKGIKPNFSVYIKIVKDLHKISRGDLSSQLKFAYSKFCPSTDEAR